MIQHSKSINHPQISNPKDILILNADDYGYNSHIDSGIIELLSKKQIKSISVIVNGANIEKAVSNVHLLK